MPNQDQNATPLSDTAKLDTALSQPIETPPAAAPAPATGPSTAPLPAAPTVDGTRLTFIWAEALPQFLEQKIPSASPWSVLTRADIYRSAFNSAQTSSNLPVDPAKPTDFRPPWRMGQKQFFWMRYLIQSDLNAVKGDQAWKNLVPLRVPSPHSIDEDDPLVSLVEIRSFYYPFGMALAITVNWGPNLSPEEFVQNASYLRDTQTFTTSASPKPIRIREFADLTLKAMRERCLGPGATTGRQSQDPFTILTVTDASGIDSSIDVSTLKDTLKVLEGVSNWRPDWSTGTLPPTSETILPTKKTAPPGSALYARERGRAIWFPALFTMPFSRRSTLTCYHQNLVFASIQVEALAQLIGLTAAAFAAGKQKIDLTASHRACAQNAAVALANLYRGDKSKTWRSASAQRHIKDACFNDLATVLAAFGEPSL